MFNLFFKILNNFYSKNKIKFCLLGLMSVFAGIFEYIGLVFIFQFILFLSNPNSVYCKKVILFFKDYLNITDFNKISLILGVFIAGIYIAKNIYMLIFTKYNNKILEDLSLKITIKTFRNLLFAPYIMTKALTESEKLNVLSKITFVVWQYCYKFINFITNIVIILILTFFLFFKFTKIALVTFVLLSILASFEYIYLKQRSNSQNSKYTIALENVNKILLVIINSIKEIKINNKEEFFLSKSKEEYKKLASLNKDRNFNTVIHIYITEISVMLGFIVILISLFYTTNFNNQILISSLCTICVLVLRLTPSINRAQSALYSINSNKQAVLDLIDFDEKFKTCINIDNTEEKLKFTDSIKLENVSFSYDKNEGLKNINLLINKNDYIHIIGKSGSYKTTLALILSGLIKADTGKMFIDNSELIEYKKWQNNVAFLSQDFVFLYDEVNKIIDYKDEKTNEYLNKLDLKNIENKKITELSSGEKQRIALVDILIKDKNVIILDEATANIDTSSQNEIINILNNFKGQKTIISITHRLENIKDNDKVIFINNGNIIFDNYFNLKQNELFKKIFDLA
ncbi:MAG: ABC transporter ATP-binding protein [Candidatus Gastranaerophilales bacterium]|nr:ABC transporter ATP-binding protein [Candidatus Gastranaerophilales bacterium]